MSFKGQRVRRSFPTREAAEAWEGETKRRLEEGLPPNIDMQPPGSVDMETLKNRTFDRSWKGTRSEVTALAPAALRVIPDHQGGVLHYDIVVPGELKNIIVLDASRPIRRLCKEDPTVLDAEQHIPAAMACPVLFARIKDYRDVTIHHWQRAGGRGAMWKGFQGQRQVVNAIVDVIKSIPGNEAVLLHVFKRRPSDRNVDYIDILSRHMRRCGIDPDEQLPDGSHRISFSGWGQHESTNEYAQCRNVILAGVLHLPHHTVAARCIGQADNITRRFARGELDELVQSEACHAMYQAMSRGACRKTTNGKAHPMKAWIIYSRPKTIETLRDVMPNVKIVPWEPVGRKRRTPRQRPSDGKIHKLAQRIACYLNDPKTRGRGKISSQQLKQELGVSARWEHARLEAVPAMTPGWSLECRSVVYSPND
ncbi:MAG: hypothetical protein GC162_12635 [Planctomycetes bacterium]|nr:hypothetical protein [Planctomycetota bacterium]